MNIDDVTRNTYATGRFVTVNGDSVGRYIRAAERTLGVEHKDHEFEIITLPKAVHERTPINAACDVVNGLYMFPEEQHEATIFHESVHLLMYRHGVLFGPDRQAANIFDRMVDETVAELATSEVFGYGELVGEGGFVDLGAAVGNIDYDVLKDVLGNEVDDNLGEMLRAMSGDFIIRAHEIYSMIRDIEDGYSATGDFDAVAEDVGTLYEKIGSLDPISAELIIASVIREVAIENAKALAGIGVNAKDLVTWLRDGVSNRWDGYGLYFADIVMGKSKGS